MHSTRRTSRRLRRYTTRMLGGVRRRPPTDWLRLACLAFGEVIKIDERLHPFMQEQRRLLEQQEWRATCELALRKIYGPPNSAAPKPINAFPPPVKIRQILKDEQALQRSQILVASLQAKLARKR